MKTVLTLLMLLFLFYCNPSAQVGWNLQVNPMGLGEQAMLGRVEFVSPTEGWISGSRGTLLHTTDAGISWNIVNPWPQDTMWIGSDPGYVMDWVDAMHGWKLDNLGPSYGVSTAAFLHKTTDGGVTWTRKVLSDEAGDFGFKIQFVDQNNGWLMLFNFNTWTPKFLRTNDGGENWFPFNGAGIFYFFDANNGWSFYGSGQGFDPPFHILRTTDGGTNWIEQFTDNTKYSYNDMYFSDVNNGWIVGDSGKVLKTINGGENWAYVTNSGVNPNNRSKTVFFLNANVGWISSKSTLPSNVPIIQHTTDGGASWTTQDPPIEDAFGSNAIFSIFFFDENNGWLTADWGRICKFTGVTDIKDEQSSNRDFQLYQNFPNPFNPATTIHFTIVNTQLVQLKIYDMLGDEIAILVNEEKAPGTYEAEFNASSLPSGVYMYKLLSGNFTTTKKMILLR